MLLSGVLPATGSIAIHTYVREWRWTSEPLHATVEAIGAFAALTLGILFILLGKGEKDSTHRLWISSALIGMGLLDAMHAAAQPGLVFVWLHSTATLVGGVLFAMTWMPGNAVRFRSPSTLAAMVATVALILGTFSFTFSQALPLMVSHGGFTPAAKAINFLGGILFLAAGARFLLRYLAAGTPDDLILVHLCLLFGMAGLLFQFSSLWDANWWFWHLVRLAAYLLALVYAFVIYERAGRALRKAHSELEIRIQERTAELEAANKELEAFSYSVSHDLRAPLRAIDGFSQALVEDYSDKLDAEAKRYIERVRAGAQRMARLIDDLLKLSRISRAQITRERVELSDLARDITEDLRAREPDRTVACDIQDGIVGEADANLTRIVLDNLLGNAWKFTRKQPKAHIEFGAHERDGNPVYFVRDNGAGFDMAYASELFGAFQRLHQSGEFEGTGIGLATVARVVHRHGGTVWSEAEVGKGATFYFTLGGGTASEQQEA